MTEKKQTAIAVPVTGGVLAPTNLNEAIEVAKHVAHSGMVPKQYDGKPGAVLVAMQMGHEIGLAPMAAIQNIAVINGRPGLWGDGMLAVCMQHPDFEDIEENNYDAIEKNQCAVCTVSRKGRTPVSATFTVEHAKKAGLWGKQGPWQQYPWRMLKLRARSFALRDAFPDALRGMSSAEEVQDIDVVNVTPPPLEEGVHKARGRKPKPEKVVDGEPVKEAYVDEPKEPEVLNTDPEELEGDSDGGLWGMDKE